MATKNLVLALLGGLFLIGALFIVAGERLTGRRVGEVWRIYGVQVVVSSWIVLPAWLGGWWLTGAILITAAVTSWEMLGVLASMGERPWRLLGTCISLAYCGLALLPRPEPFLAGPVFAALGLLAAPVLGLPLAGAFPRSAATLFATLYPGLCLAFAARLPRLGNEFGDYVYLYLVLELNDSFAFLFGNYLGRKKLSPLSPNKTLAGSLGGLAMAVLMAGLLAPRLLGLPVSLGALIGLGLGFVGQVADLAASAIKRQAGVKDYSNLAPKQGGLMDLYDSFIFAAPLWFVFLSVLRRHG